MVDAEKDVCAICLESLASRLCYRLTQCRHMLHVRCFREWQSVANSKTCPLCRRSFVIASEEDEDASVVSKKENYISIDSLENASFTNLLREGLCMRVYFKKFGFGGRSAGTASSYYLHDIYEDDDVQIETICIIL